MILMGKKNAFPERPTYEPRIVNFKTSAGFSCLNCGVYPKTGDVWMFSSRGCLCQSCYVKLSVQKYT